MVNYLIVTRGDIKRNQGDFKAPGVRFVEELQQKKIFKLIDLPSTYRFIGIRKFFRKYFLISRIIYIRAKNGGDFTFYNFTKAYIPTYLIILSAGRIPNLLLADGENCLFFERIRYIYTKVFKKKIYLSNILYKENTTNSLWLPGILDNRSNIGKNYRIKRLYDYDILYNSSFKKNNEPEKILEFAKNNSHLKIALTGNSKSFHLYLSTIKIIENFPKNIYFTGNLNYIDYLELLNKIKAILLIRNELYFENRTNFPSKFIEALNYRIPLLCIGKISGVPESLYKKINISDKISLNDINIFDRYNINNDIILFKNYCRPENLKEFINKC